MKVMFSAVIHLRRPTLSNREGSRTRFQTLFGTGKSGTPPGLPPAPPGSVSVTGLPSNAAGLAGAPYYNEINIDQYIILYIYQACTRANLYVINHADFGNPVVYSVLGGAVLPCPGAVPQYLTDCYLETFNIAALQYFSHFQLYEVPLFNITILI